MLWVLIRSALVSTQNICFHGKIRKLSLFFIWENITNLELLSLVLLNLHPAFTNSADPDQLASEEANWSGSALFAINYMNLSQLGSSNLMAEN